MVDTKYALDINITPEMRLSLAENSLALSGVSLDKDSATSCYTYAQALTSHGNALDYVIQTLSDPLSVDLLRTLHSKVTYAWAADNGVFREDFNSENLDEVLEEFMSKANRRLIEFTWMSVAEIYTDYMSIAPMREYNELVGRLLIVRESLRRRLPICILQLEDANAIRVAHVSSWQRSDHSEMAALLESRVCEQKIKSVEDVTVDMEETSDSPAIEELDFDEIAESLCDFIPPALRSKYSESNTEAALVFAWEILRQQSM